MKHVGYIFALTAFVASCGNPAAPDSDNPVGGTVNENPSEPIQLSKADLFDGESVRLFLFQNKEVNQESNQEFLKALDEFKNKKNLQAAAEGFLTSIVTYPTSKAYYELGNVYMEQKNYKQALNAYSLAEKLGYEPFSKVLFNVACVHSQLKNYPLSADYLQYAIQSGYSNIDNIEKDTDLKNLREEEPYLFKSKMDKALSGISDVENLHWLQFKRNFVQASFPINMNADQGKVILDEKNRISYDFERYVSEMRDERFSREVSKSFFNYVQVTETNNFVALIYIVRDEFIGDLAPLTYRLVTFTKTGKIIDKMEIAGREDYSEELKMCTFNKDLTFTVSNYETTFQKEPSEEGYYDNPIVSKKKVSASKYRIDASGKIQFVTNINIAA